MEIVVSISALRPPRYGLDHDLYPRRLGRECGTYTSFMLSLTVVGYVAVTCPPLRSKVWTPNFEDSQLQTGNPPSTSPSTEHNRIESVAATLTDHRSTSHLLLGSHSASETLILRDLFKRILRPSRPRPPGAMLAMHSESAKPDS